jgi:hypothetical protein
VVRMTWQIRGGLVALFAWTILISPSAATGQT